MEWLKPNEVKEIARQLNVSESDVVEMEGRFSGHEIALESGADDDEDNYAPIAYLATDAEDEPSQMLEQAEAEHLQTAGLGRALDSLDERSRRITEARWLQEGGTATLHELAAEFGVSAERIRQIEQKAMARMQTALVAV